MGNKHSTGVIHTDIFKSELQSLNEIITGILNKEGTSFKNKSYDVSVKDVCESYNMVLQSSLKKRLKVDLKMLNDSIYLIPKNDVVSGQNNYINKSDLCHMISNHYNKILKLLLTIKYVYDLEHSGDDSLAGITLKNINFSKNILEVRYCDIAQKMYSTTGTTDYIDFSALSGFRFFCDELLTSSRERNMFLKNMRNLLARKPLKLMAQHMLCGDDLLSSQEYNVLLQNGNVRNIKCNQKLNDKYMSHITSHVEDMNMYVAKDNPLLHDTTCLDKRQLLIDCSVKTKEVQTLLDLHRQMKQSYNKNISNISKLITLLVDKQSNNEYSLKDITYQELNNIETKVKKIIASFYFQSLINFYTLLDYAKTLKTHDVGWKDKIDL